MTATGHINITPETKNYNGDILLNVSVREVGSQKQSLRKTIPVSVAPVNDPPVATLQSPASGTAQDGVNATLSWSYRDVDNALGDISFDLYFGKTESPPLLESGIKERKFNVTDLDDFTKYYWKVIPYDDENPGNCSSGVWNLTVDSLLNIPKVRLLAPASGVVIDELQVNISWEVMNNPTGKPLSYRIFLGPSPDNMSHKYNTKMTEYVLKDLQPSEDYYWSVEPYTSKGDGICLSEPNVWKITVGDVPVYKLLMETLITEITVPVGESRSINFTLINQGNRVLDVQVEIAGNISEHVTISDSMEVAIGETVFLDITIENPGTYPLGDYGIDITLTHEAGTNRKHVNVKYSKKPGNGGKEENGKDSFLVQYGLYIAGGVVLLLLFIILIVVIIVKVRKKKQDRIAAKKAKEEQEKRTREEEERKRFQAEQEALAKDHSRWRRDDVDYSKFEQVDTDGWEKDYMDEVKKEMKGAGQVRDLLAGAGTFSLEGDKPTGPVFGASMKVLDDDDAPSVQPQPTPAPAGAQAATRRPTPPPAAPVRPSKLPTATTRAVTGAPATTRPVTSPGGTAQPRQPTMTRPPGPPAATASPVTSPTASAAPPKVVLKPTEPAMEKDGKKAKGDTALDSVLKELELDKW